MPFDQAYARTTLPPWLQQQVPPGYQVTPPSMMPTTPLDPTAWLPIDMPDATPAPVSSTPSSDTGIDLGFSPVDASEAVGVGVLEFLAALDALAGIYSTAGHPTVGVP